jgi:tetratricopeptide (TPR) repeat protein
VVVLWGMGGCGKTQLALEHCRQGREQGRYKSIFWIDASSPNSIAQSFAGMEELIFDRKVELQNAGASIEKVIKAMSLWQMAWLIVFDNFDDPEFFRGKNMQDYFPEGRSGAILFTSRNKVAGRLGHLISVNGLTEDEGLDLLSASADINLDENKAAARAIVRRLGYHALALDQAGAYISARGLALQLFMDHYDARREKVLKETPLLWEYTKRLVGDDIHAQETALSAFATWEMSFDQIRDGPVFKATKVHLLTVSAFFDNQEIFEEFFNAYLGTVETKERSWFHGFSRDAAWSSYEFQDVMAELRNLSLLQNLDITESGAHFSLHPLIKDWVKLRMEPRDYSNYAIEAIMMLSAYLNTCDITDMTLGMKRTLTSHLSESSKNDNEYLNEANGLGSPGLKFAALNFAKFYQSQGQYKAAEELYGRIVACWETEYGASHIDTLRMVGNHATVYHIQGNYEQAERLYSRVLEGARKQLDDEHVDLLQTLHNLAIVYYSLERLDDAERFCKEALQKKEKTLGRNERGTLRSAHTLAMIYDKQGRNQEAEMLYKRVLETTSLTAEHPSTLETLHNLAICYQGQSRFEEAKQLFRRVLEAREEQLGSENPQTINTANMLIRLCEPQRERERTFQFARDVMDNGIFGKRSHSKSSGKRILLPANTNLARG